MLFLSTLLHVIYLFINNFCMNAYVHELSPFLLQQKLLSVLSCISVHLLALIDLHLLFLPGMVIKFLQGQDEHLLDSPSCIRFLIKLLKPLTHGVSKDKASTISSKLIALRKNVDILQDTSKGTDSTSAAIMLKVQEVLVSCKEMKSSDGKDKAMTTSKLTPKWIALLTLEKACLSTISLEGSPSASYYQVDP